MEFHDDNERVKTESEPIFSNLEEDILESKGNDSLVFALPMTMLILSMFLSLPVSQSPSQLETFHNDATP